MAFERIALSLNAEVRRPGPLVVSSIAMQAGGFRIFVEREEPTGVRSPLLWDKSEATWSSLRLWDTTWTAFSRDVAFVIPRGAWFVLRNAGETCEVTLGFDSSDIARLG